MSSAMAAAAAMIQPRRPRSTAFGSASTAPKNGASTRIGAGKRVHACTWSWGSMRASAPRISGCRSGRKPSAKFSTWMAKSTTGINASAANREPVSVNMSA